MSIKFCTRKCSNFIPFNGSEIVGICEYAKKDDDAPLDGLVVIGYDCEKEERYE